MIDCYDRDYDDFCESRLTGSLEMTVKTQELHKHSLSRNRKRLHHIPFKNANENMSPQSIRRDKVPTSPSTQIPTLAAIPATSARRRLLQLTGRLQQEFHVAQICYLSHTILGFLHDSTRDGA